MSRPTDKIADIEKLRRLVRRLRAPDGCPWDRKQTLVDVRAYLLEEAHEAAAAIDGGLADEVAEEMGDLLFQVVFVAQLAEEDGSFDLATVIDGIHHKMVERHPHVFGGETLADAAAVVQSWERRKAEKNRGGRSVLAGVAPTLPALTAAYRLTQKAAGVGFDWTSAREVLAKVEEELGEVEECLDTGGDKLREEVGDLLFSVANLARHLGIDPEGALAAGNRKFIRRFTAVEERLEGLGRRLAEASLDEMEAQWQEVKAAEDHDGASPRHEVE